MRHGRALRTALRSVLRYIGDSLVHFGLSVGCAYGAVPPRLEWRHQAGHADADRAPEARAAQGDSLTPAERRAWRELTRQLREQAIFDDRSQT